MLRDNPHLGGGTVTSTLPTPLTLNEQFRLQDHLQRLRLILPVISVAALALRRQGAEQDEDIAAVLMRHASDPLHVEIAKLELLLERVSPERCTEGVAA